MGSLLGHECLVQRITGSACKFPSRRLLTDMSDMGCIRVRRGKGNSEARRHLPIGTCGWAVRVFCSHCGAVPVGGFTRWGVPPVKHGLSGFQAGCRCAACEQAESDRMRSIGWSETRRWARINETADARVAVDDPEWVRPSRTRWSKTELVFLAESGLSNAEIAKRLNRSEEAVAIKRHRLQTGEVPQPRRRRRRG